MENQNKGISIRLDDLLTPEIMAQMPAALQGADVYKWEKTNLMS